MFINKKLLHLIIITVVLLAMSGCVATRGPSNPDISLFDLYVSDPDGTRLSGPVFKKGDTVHFTLEYSTAENFKPLDASNIQYEFSRLKPAGMDVHQGFPLSDLKFLDDKGNPVTTVTLKPGDSILISLTVPETQEKWDSILAQSGSRQSITFNLVIKIKDLAVPLQSNELTVLV